MKLLKIIAFFLFITYSHLHSLDHAIPNVIAPTNEEADEIDRCSTLATYLNKLKNSAVEFDKKQGKACPKLQCVQCKKEKITWAYINGHLIGSSMQAISDKIAFNKMKNIMDEFITVLAQLDMQKVSNCMLQIAQDLKIPCINCSESSWKITS
jgi:hypothetical protein